MDTDTQIDSLLVTQLRRLDAQGAAMAPAFDYDALLAREATRARRASQRLRGARIAASTLVFALVGVSVWRLRPVAAPAPSAAVQAVPESGFHGTQPRIVRADTYFAVAALEDHIANLDEALNDARLRAPRGADIARLEKTRAELVDSWARVRYAEMVSANF